MCARGGRKRKPCERPVAAGLKFTDKLGQAFGGRFDGMRDRVTIAILSAAAIAPAGEL